ncbi:cation channel family protein (macronuclear) [Tetrahymena thermophila SB210]|uniref:Cation channel family protein n=1 Tax=Tetrahymena thermophila (strain SB210) TaxID=312017 RepID=A4VEQ3_TETTS|nr:cation channel family protein [Tetrahymena thermophila SB210]EDK31995.2 cation channel family protein [Tetrahymena thermophila SB210]|eukprot:XP_001471130.2 cation channel family protein [Tetrahymena thermophila SB210]
MIFFSCVFAYSINNIGFILQEIEKSSKQLNDDIATIQRYLIRKGVNIQLKSRVRNYLQFLAHEQKDRDKQAEDKILSVLSNKLREEIISQINQKILNSNFIFISNFSQSTLSKLLFVMEEIQVNPNEVIISEYEQDDSSIYFIQNGIIEIYQQQIQKENKKNMIKVLKDGQIFGELSFFSGLQRQASARSVNLSTLYKIRRDIFIEILRENVEDFERFKMIQDQIIFQNELSSIHIECYNCKNVGHVAAQCPRIHKIKDQQLIILRQNYSNFQERAQFERNRRKYVSNSRNQILKNQAICNLLKFNLKQQNDQRFLLFKTYEIILTSEEYSISQSQSEEDDDDDDEESASYVQQNFDDQINDIYSKILQKSFTRKKTEQFSKNQKKTSIEENQCSYQNQEKINENSQISSNLENQEHKKSVFNISASDEKIKSLEILENFNNSNPNLHFRQKQFFTQQFKTIKKKDQNVQEINNLECENDKKKDSISMNFQKLDQLNSEIHNQIQMDQQQLEYITFLQEQILLMNKFFTCQILDKRISQQQQQQQPPNQNSNQDTLDAFLKQNNSDLRQKSQKNENQENKYSFIKLFRDLKEKRLSSNEQNQNQLNQNIKNKQNNFISNQFNQKQQNIQNNQNIQINDKFSSILQDSKIPLILQLSNYKSFLTIDNDASSIIINQFDKMQNFKKYFPHNNFQKVNQSQKKYQNEQKKIKKNNQGLKQRRFGLCSNITTSVYQGDFNIIKLFPQDYNINLYKPTYLSYGVKIQKGNVFPKNFNSLQKN